jgi:hypothetical protein
VAGNETSAKPFLLHKRVGFDEAEYLRCGCFFPARG